MNLSSIIRFARRAFRVSIGLLAVLLLLSMGCYWAGARMNLTKSIPVGLYWTSPAMLKKGAYVLFCPPKNRVFDMVKQRGYINAGLCSGHYSYMMKKVLAVPGDIITITHEGVRVNKALLPHSAPLETDSYGRPLPRHWIEHYTLSASELLVMSDMSDTSFDGRYFGPIDRAQIKTVVKPILTWPRL